MNTFLFRSRFLKFIQIEENLSYFSFSLDTLYSSVLNTVWSTFKKKKKKKFSKKYLRTQNTVKIRRLRKRN